MTLKRSVKSSNKIFFLRLRFGAVKVGA